MPQVKLSRLRLGDSFRIAADVDAVLCPHHQTGELMIVTLPKSFPFKANADINIGVTVTVELYERIKERERNE